MHSSTNGRLVKLTSILTLATALTMVSSTAVFAAGGSNSGGGGGGGSTKVVEAVVNGYVTAIDHSAGTISIGASYYGSGVLKVTSSTKISVNTSNGSFSAIKVGDWAEARYLWSTREATKISVTKVSP